MSGIFFLFYGVAVLIILGGGVLVYWWVGRHHRILGVLAGMFSAAALALIWPIPIHGGFTFLGAIVFDELRENWERGVAVYAARKDQRFMQGLEARFAGVLEYERVVERAGNWSTVTLPMGGIAWMDKHSGLIWSEPLLLMTDTPLSALEAGKTLCREQVPAGYWALPTEAERYQFWRAAGRQHLPHKVAPAMAYIVDEDMGMELSSVSLSPTGSGNNNTGSAIQLMLLCVARGPAAPARGYIRSDIPLPEWNRYQMAKAVGQ
jgi:hypothetical protein